jgi:Protein of unknown function (DUF3987)
VDTSQDGSALEARVRAIVDSLPAQSFLRNYVFYGTNLTDANAVCHIAGGLALLTQTVPDDLCARLGPRLFGNIYTMVVGPSTESRKTSAVSLAREVMIDALPGRVVENPGSEEGLQESLGLQPRQLHVYEEWGNFLQESLHGYQQKIKTCYALAYDGSPIGHRLVSGGKNKVTRFPCLKPRLSLLAAVATDYLSRYTEPVDWTGGFFARFLTFLAPRCRELERTPPDNLSHRAWVLRRLQELYACQLVPGPYMDLTPDAAAYWHEWNQWRAYFARQWATSKTAGAIGRAPALAFKIALLLSWDAGAIRPGPWEIQLDQLMPAVAIVNLHLESVLRLGESIGGTTDMNDRQAVLRAMDGGPVSAGQIQEKSFLLKKRVLEILESLMEEEAITARQRSDGSGLTRNFYERNSRVISLPQPIRRE